MQSCVYVRLLAVNVSQASFPSSFLLSCPVHPANILPTDAHLPPFPRPHVAPFPHAMVTEIVYACPSPAVACSFSPEALTSLASFTESLSLCLGFLARANRLTAQTSTVLDGSVPPARQSHPNRRSGSRRRSSVSAHRRTTGSGADEGKNGVGWAVSVDLRKVDALLTMLKQLDDQESAAHLMGAGNQVNFAEVEEGVLNGLWLLARGLANSTRWARAL